MIKRTLRKKITSECGNAYLATTKPELQITVKIHGAQVERAFVDKESLT
jgi:hypothetical protein